MLLLLVKVKLSGENPTDEDGGLSKNGVKDVKDQFDIRTLMVGDALVVGLTSCMVMGFTIKGYIDVSDGFKRKNVLVTRLGC